MFRVNRTEFRKEEGEPALRSCWECNPAHEHLKDETCESLFVCFSCGRYYVFGRFTEDFDTDEKLFSFLNERFDAKA